MTYICVLFVIISDFMKTFTSELSYIRIQNQDHDLLVKADTFHFVPL